MDKAKASYDATNLAVADGKALLELEFDLKLSLVALRDFNIHCKKRQAVN
jgi:hypothetical protein